MLRLKILCSSDKQDEVDVVFYSLCFDMSYAQELIFDECCKSFPILDNIGLDG